MLTLSLWPSFTCKQGALVISIAVRHRRIHCTSNPGYTAISVPYRLPVMLFKQHSIQLQQPASHIRVHGAAQRLNGVARTATITRSSSPHHHPGAALLAGLLLVSSGPAAAAADPIAVLEGAARIVDGDTLYIGSEKVRLYAVDAPEKAQACSDSQGRSYPCGQLSWQALKQHVGDNRVRCEVKNKDQYGRNVAACRVLSQRAAEDMGMWLVSNGYAVAYKQFGKDYVVMEEKAHARHVGIWQGEFTEPALWRKQQKAASLAAATGGSGGSRLPSAPALVSQPLASSSPGSSSTAPGAPSYAAVAAAGLGQAARQVPVAAAGPPAPPVCSGVLIKGNINSKGEKIYHTPASGSYARVEIDERQGERYFCSEQEAVAAGWRPAQK